MPISLNPQRMLYGNYDPMFSPPLWMPAPPPSQFPEMEVWYGGSSYTKPGTMPFEAITNAGNYYESLTVPVPVDYSDPQTPTIFSEECDPPDKMRFFLTRTKDWTTWKRSDPGNSDPDIAKSIEYLDSDTFIETIDPNTGVYSTSGRDTTEGKAGAEKLSYSLTLSEEYTVAFICSKEAAVWSAAQPISPTSDQWYGVTIPVPSGYGTSVSLSFPTFLKANRSAPLYRIKHAPCATGYLKAWWKMSKTVNGGSPVIVKGVYEWNFAGFKDASKNWNEPENREMSIVSELNPRLMFDPDRANWGDEVHFWAGLYKYSFLPDYEPNDAGTNSGWPGSSTGPYPFGPPPGP